MFLVYLHIMFLLYSYTIADKQLTNHQIYQKASTVPKLIDKNTHIKT